MTEPTDLCYPVREPFKFRRVVVKPPAFVQMGRDEAKPYIAVGVIGGEDEACLVPGDAERLEAARLEAERQAVADAEAARLEAERKTAADAEAARLEAERKTAADAEAARLEAERKAADTATDTGAPNGSTTPNGAAAPGGADAGATDGATAAADAAKGAGEESKTAKDGDTKTTAAGAPAAGGRGARKAAR
jgi:hypothetical protein